MTKERKIILIIGAILLGAASIYRFYPLIVPSFGTDQEILLKQEKLSRYLRISKEIKSLEANLVVLNRSLDRSEFVLINAEKAPLAAVEIKNILTEIATRSNVEIQTMRDIPSEKKAGQDQLKDRYAPIRVQINFVSNIWQLKEILFKIEAHEKLINIVDCRLNINYGGDEDTIKSKLTVEGYMKKYES